MTNRRKRSEMTIEDAQVAFAAFAPKVLRFAETSQEFLGPNPESDKGKITVVFQITGSYGVANDLFEAIRVLGGHKLPKKAKS